MLGSAFCARLHAGGCAAVHRWLLGARPLWRYSNPPACCPALQYFLEILQNRKSDTLEWIISEQRGPLLLLILCPVADDLLVQISQWPLRSCLACSVLPPLPRLLPPPLLLLLPASAQPAPLAPLCADRPCGTCLPPPPAAPQSS